MSSMFTRKSRQDVMLEAILTVECTLSMMKIDGIGVKESDGGFMTTIWDIYCRPSTPGKVRIFWVCAVDDGSGNVSAQELEERICADNDPSQIATQFVDLMVAVISKFARQRAIDILAEAHKGLGPRSGLTLEYLHQVNEKLPGPK